MKKTGTKEWAESNINCKQVGCKNDCRYCYAAEMSNRYGHCPREKWGQPICFFDNRQFKKRKGIVMFPTAHDIYLENLNTCRIVLYKLLDADNEVLIVSKPRLDCMKKICDGFRQYQKQITFRFTIGSINNDVLRFWDRKSPDFDERIECLAMAFRMGYRTSVSCEPYLDSHPQYTYEACKNYITDSFWLGLLRQWKRRVDMTGVTEGDIERYVKPLQEAQRHEAVCEVYRVLEDESLVRFKDSFREALIW